MKRGRNNLTSIRHIQNRSTKLAEVKKDPGLSATAQNEAKRSHQLFYNSQFTPRKCLVLCATAQLCPSAPLLFWQLIALKTVHLNNSDFGNWYRNQKKLEVWTDDLENYCEITKTKIIDNSFQALHKMWAVTNSVEPIVAFLNWIELSFSVHEVLNILGGFRSEFYLVSFFRAKIPNLFSKLKI